MAQTRCTVRRQHIALQYLTPENKRSTPGELSLCLSERLFMYHKIIGPDQWCRA